MCVCAGIPELQGGYSEEGILFLLLLYGGILCGNLTFLERGPVFEEKGEKRTK